MKGFAIVLSLVVLASSAAGCPSKPKPDAVDSASTSPDASTPEPEPDTSASSADSVANPAPDAAGNVADAGPAGTPGEGEVAVVDGVAPEVAPVDYVRFAIARGDAPKPEVVAELKVFEVLEANVDLTKLDGVKAVVSADAASIATGNDERDKSARGPDFLDADKAPKITYAIDRLKVVEGVADTYDATAAITMRGVTKEVPVRVVVVEKKADGAIVVEVEAKDLARVDWGITAASQAAPPTFTTLLRLTLTNKVAVPK